LSRVFEGTVEAVKRWFVASATIESLDVLFQSSLTRRETAPFSNPCLKRHGSIQARRERGSNIIFETASK